MSDTFAIMNEERARFYFDAVDPMSFLMDREIRVWEATSGRILPRIPVELRPAPAALTDTDDPVWVDRWADAQALWAGRADGEPVAALRVPSVVPRSRKAHELILHAEESGKGAAALEAIFAAFFLDGLDIGRVDVLVEIGRGLGLDFTETKAVLDVDRFEAEAARLGEEAHATGVHSVPHIAAPNTRLEGFHSSTALGTLLVD